MFNGNYSMLDSTTNKNTAKIANKPINNNNINIHQFSKEEKSKDAISTSTTMNVYTNKTSAQVVGRNTEIMTLIVQNIPIHKERKNIALTCRNFYSICTNRRTYVQPLEHKKEQILDVNNKFKTWRLIFFKNSIKINLCEYKIETMNELESRRHLIEQYLIKSTDISIYYMNPFYFQFFKSLNGYENIKSLTLYCFSTKTIPLYDMWCKIETLKPTTMLLCVRSLKEEIVEEFDIKIPDSVSNVYLASAPSEYKAILSVFKNSNKKKFNKLVSKIDIDELDMGQNIFKEIISCFRETTIILNDCFNEYPSNYCKDVFSRCEFLYHPNITLEQLYEIRWDSFNNVFETFQEEKIPIIHNNDLIRLGYLLMKSLKMDSCNDENRALTRTEFYHFKNDLSRMCNLQTLCLDFNVMKGLRRFETICSSINYNLENLELFGCTDIKKIHLDILSKYCEKIKNLSIYTITSNTVRIKDIIKNFKHLEGLYLHFDDSYNVKNILKDLKTKLVTKGEYKLRWPRLKFLFITCPVPNEWGMKIIKSMDMNTQRKSGKFILEQFTNTRKYDEYKIIIQESSLFFSKFLKIFSSDIPLTMRDYYFY